VTLRAQLSLPSYDGVDVVVPAPDAGPGNWSGAACALLHDRVFWLAYRVRRPLNVGRGVNVVIARSDDGVSFQPAAEVFREAFGSESFERPALVVLPDGRWRLYLSCATPGSKHWWVDSLTADSPEALPEGHRQVVLPGDDDTAVKDPVVTIDADGWRMWLCCHPLTDLGHEDRMTSRLLTSDDGLAWTDRGEVLRGEPGQWDARGARATAVVGTDPVEVLYDGRPDAASNWHETTGLARWEGDRLVPDRTVRPIASPHSDGAFRYACAVPLPDGRVRYYLEAARPDGAHDLISCVR